MSVRDRQPERDVLAECVSISKHCMAREYYKGLMACRKLIDYEDERLGHGASGVPENLQAATQAESPRQTGIYRRSSLPGHACADGGGQGRSERSGRNRGSTRWTGTGSGLDGASGDDCANPRKSTRRALLRASIISLAILVGRYTSAVIRRQISIEPLIEVNRMIMQGLSPSPSAGGSAAA